MDRPKAEQIRVIALAAVLAVLAVVVVVRVAGRGGSSGGDDAGDRVSYTGHGLPVLETADLDHGDPEQAEFDRNPFIYGVRPTSTPRPVTPAPTREIVRRTPRPTPTPRVARLADGSEAPPPPPFNRDFIGHFGPVDLQVAAFRLVGDDPDLAEIEVAKAGDVLDDIFIIREIGFESVMIGFVGYAPSEDTRVPLAEQ
jgi:hypothetical protein